MSAAAQAPVDVTFYYPVAVGGPVTKIIDGLAADFEKENPGIKVKPIYAGTYQETIVKVLTALKSGEPPQMSVLLSTDMFTLIDEDAIVPFDDMATSAEDKAWMKSFFPAFMLNSQTGGKTWGIPFQRSTIVLYWNKEPFKEAGLDPNKPPATWAEQLDYAKKLTKRDASGNVTQWGLEVPSSGLPLLALPGLHHAERRPADERGRHGDLLRQARRRGGAPVLGGPQREAQGHAARHHRVGHHAEGLLREEDRDDVDDHRQPHQREEQRQVRVRRGHAAGGQAARLADGRRQLLHLQEEHARPAGGLAQVHQVDHLAGASGAVGHRHRLRGRAARRVGDAGR